MLLSADQLRRMPFSSRCCLLHVHTHTHTHGWTDRARCFFASRLLLSILLPIACNQPHRHVCALPSPRTALHWTEFRSFAIATVGHGCGDRGHERYVLCKRSIL